MSLRYQDEKLFKRVAVDVLDEQGWILKAS